MLTRKHTPIEINDSVSSVIHLILSNLYFKCKLKTCKHQEKQKLYFFILKNVFLLS